MSIEAMKLALEALRTLHDENMDYFTRNKLGGENNQCMVFARETITALRQAIAEAEQAQPVAYIRVSKTGDVMACAKTADFYKLPDKTLLYTTPPQRKPLTDEEIKAVRVSCGNPLAIHLEFARAIEAAHGIKENT